MQEFYEKRIVPHRNIYLWGLVALFLAGLVIGLTFFAVRKSHAAATTCYWVGVANPDSWNNAANWSSSSGGAGSTCDGGVVPGSDDTVIFDSSNTNGVTIDADVNIASLNLQLGYSGTFDNATNDHAITVSGNVTMDNTRTDMGTATWTIGGNFDFRDITTLNVNGSTVTLTGSGKTINAKASSVTPLARINVTGSYSFDALSGILESRSTIVTISGTLSVGSGKTFRVGYSGGELKVTSTGKITGSGETIVYFSAIISQQDGIIDVATLTLNYLNTPTSIAAGTYASATVAITNTYGTKSLVFGPGTTTFNGNVTFSVNFAGAVYTIDNSVNNPNLVFKGNLTLTQTNGTITWTKGTGTIAFSGTGAQTANFLNKTVDTIQDSNTASTLQLTNGVTTDHFVVDANATLLLNSQTVNYASAASTDNSGTIQLVGNEIIGGNITDLDTDSGTVEYTGGGAYSPLPYTGIYNSVAFSGAGSYTLPNSLTLNGSFSQSAGTVIAPSGTLAVAGNFSHSAGTFTHNAGTVSLDGSSQAVSGDTTFNNLTKSVTAADTMTLEANKTQTVAGALTLTGASGNLLTLRSSSDGTQWKIDPQGTVSISYVDSKDSNNISGTTIIDSHGANSGNNTDWLFPDHYSLSASTSAGNPGLSATLTVTREDANSNTDSGYSGTTNLTFSGANSSPNSNAPTASDASSNDVSFGTATSLSFTNGVATTTLKLYKSETAQVAVNDGTYSSSATSDIALTSPEGTVSIQNASTDTYSNSLDVALDFTLTNVSDSSSAQVKLSNDSDSGLPSASWNSYSTPYNWTLSNGDGDKSVYALFADVYGNQSSSVQSNTTKVDATAPTDPSNVKVYNASDPNAQTPIYSAMVLWQPSTDDTSGLKGYVVYRDDTQLQVIDGITNADQINTLDYSGTQYLYYADFDSNLSADGTYAYKVKALDNVGNESQTITATNPDTSTNTVSLAAQQETSDNPVTEITNIKIKQGIVDDNNKTSATVTFKTDAPAKVVVDYGTTSSYGQQVTKDAFNTSHKIFIPSLDAQSTYNLKITATDRFGNFVESANQAFTTLSQEESQSIIQTILDSLSSFFTSIWDAIKGFFSVGVASAQTQQNPEDLSVVTLVNCPVDGIFSNFVFWPQGQGSAALTRDGNQVAEVTSNYAVDPGIDETKDYNYVVGALSSAQTQDLATGQPNITDISVSGEANKLLVSWNTQGIPSTGTVTITKDDGSTVGTQTDPALNESHSFILTDNIAAGGTYLVTVSSTDSSGLTTTSDPVSFTIPQGADQQTILEIIYNAIKDAFVKLYNWIASGFSSFSVQGDTFTVSGGENAMLANPSLLYHFDNADNPTLDSSPNGLNGSVASAAVWNSAGYDEQPGSYTFDRTTNSYISVSTPTALRFNGENGDSFSGFAWVKPNFSIDGTSQQGTIMSQITGSETSGWRFLINRGSVVTQLSLRLKYPGMTGTYALDYTTTSLPNGTWAYVGFVVDETNDIVKLYINGQPVASSTTLSSLNHNVADYDGLNFLVGKTWASGSEFKGDIDEVLVLDRVPTDGEITQQYDDYLDHYTPPTLHAIGSRVAQVNTNVTFTVAADSPYGWPLTYSASGLPAGATFDPNTQVFSWTPDTVGQYDNITFSVTDGTQPDSETISIRVIDTISADSLLANPTAFYYFDDAADPSPDLGPHNLPADIVGANWISSGYNGQPGAYSFNGSDSQYISLGDHPELRVDGSQGESFSGFAWVKPNFANGALQQNTVMANIRGTEAYGWRFLISNSSIQTSLDLRLKYPDMVGEYTLSYAPADIPNGIWSYVGFVVDETNDIVKLYVNGRLVKSSTTLAAINHNVADYDGMGGLLIGKTWASGSGFNGSMDNVLFLDWAPTNGQVKRQYDLDLDQYTAPTLNAIGGQVVELGTHINFTISANSPYGWPLTYSASNLPAGATFDEDTQVFDWTPSSTGTFDGITFSVTDGVETDSNAIKIRVINQIDSSRPRVLLNHNNLAQFQANWTNGSMPSVVNRVRNYLSTSIPTPNEANTNSLNVQYDDMFLADCYEYLATGNTAYRDQAINWALSVASWDAASGPTSFGEDVDKSRVVMWRLGQAYDTLYNDMTQQQRDTIKASLLTHVNTWYNYYSTSKDIILGDDRATEDFISSHRVSAIGYFTAAAVALYGEEANAPSWLSWLLGWYADYYPPWGMGDGGYSEGLPYLSTTGSYMNNMISIDILVELTGVDLWSENPWYKTSGDMYMYLWPPNIVYGTNGSSSGSTWGDGGASTALDGFMRPNMWMAGYYMRNPQWIWYAKNVFAKWVSTAPSPDLLGYPNPSYKEYFLVAMAARYVDDQITEEPPTQNTKYFADIGEYSMHTNIADPYNDLSLDFKSTPWPRASISHGHADQNSFLMNAWGSPIVVANNWSGETSSYNSLLFGGVGQRYTQWRGRSSLGNNETGEILAHSDNGKYAYAVGATTGTYAANGMNVDRFNRYAILVKDGGNALPYAIIVDDTQTPADQTVTWTLGLGRQGTLDPNNLTIDMTFDNSSAYNHDAAMKVKVMPSATPTSFAQDNPTNGGLGGGLGGYRTLMELPATQQAKIAAVIQPYQPSQSSEVVSYDNISGGAWSEGNGYRVNIGADTVDINFDTYEVTLSSSGVTSSSTTTTSTTTTTTTTTDDKDKDKDKDDKDKDTDKDIDKQSASPIEDLSDAVNDPIGFTQDAIEAAATDVQVTTEKVSEAINSVLRGEDMTSETPTQASLTTDQKDNLLSAKQKTKSVATTATIVFASSAMAVLLPAAFIPGWFTKLFGAGV